jgi:hypothetical protein
MEVERELSVTKECLKGRSSLSDFLMTKIIGD